MANGMIMGDCLQNDSSQFACALMIILNLGDV